MAAIRGDVDGTLFISLYNGDGVMLHLGCGIWARSTCIMVYMSSVETWRAAVDALLPFSHSHQVGALRFVSHYLLCLVNFICQIGVVWREIAGCCGYLSFPFFSVTHAPQFPCSHSVLWTRWRWQCWEKGICDNGEDWGLQQWRQKLQFCLLSCCLNATTIH